MKHLISFLVTLLLLPAAATAVHASVNVFTCEPEWAALAEEIGGEHVSVRSATTAMQDVHHIQARPSLIARLRQADLLICTGAGLEEAWLPLLLRRANNPRVQPGKPGYLEAADHVMLQQLPARIDRAKGDIHPRGNPHLHLDPRNIRHIAEVAAERFAAIDPEHAAHYRDRLEFFNARWHSAVEGWETKARPLAGTAIAVHHDSWVYLTNWLGIEVVGTLEPKPGIPPSSAHLGRLLGQLRKHPARIVIRSSYQDPKASTWLADRAGIRAVELPFSVGGSDDAPDLFGLFDAIIRRLLEATS